MWKISIMNAVAALHQGKPGQMTWLENPPPWLGNSVNIFAREDARQPKQLLLQYWSPKTDHWISCHVKTIMRFPISDQ